MAPDFEKEIHRITQQIIEKYNPEKIILFGSAARGEGDPDSDADFLIIKKDTPTSSNVIVEVIASIFPESISTNRGRRIT